MSRANNIENLKYHANLSNCVSQVNVALVLWMSNRGKKKLQGGIGQWQSNFKVSSLLFTYYLLYIDIYQKFIKVYLIKYWTLCNLFIKIY